MPENELEQITCAILAQECWQETPSASPDWNALAAYARTQGVAPLLYWRFQTLGWPASMPGETRQALTQAYHAISASNTLLFSELGRLLAAFTQAGIPVVVLKGAALSTTIYPNLALRPMVDVDLLVPRPLFSMALHIATEELGYQEFRQMVTPQLEQLVDYHVHLTGGPAGKVHMELHWSLVTSDESWYAAPIGWFWEQTQPYPLEQVSLQLARSGGDVRMFTPAAQTLHLAGHAMLQHGIGHVQLLWLYDLHALIEAQGAQIDWDALAQQAERLHWANALGSALAETQTRFGTRLPDGLIERLQQVDEPHVSWLVGLKKRFPGTRLMGDWYTLLSLRGSARARYVWSMIFPRPAYIHWRYHPRPDWVWPLYYPYRWLRAAWDALRALARLAWRSA